MTVKPGQLCSVTGRKRFPKGTALHVLNVLKAKSRNGGEDSPAYVSECFYCDDWHLWYSNSQMKKAGGKDK
jgi:hypothetical protein